jgi:hypothetical protein
MKNYPYYKSFVYLAIGASLITCISCHYYNQAKETPDDIVGSWVGKKIIFPIGTPCSTLGEYSSCSLSSAKPYKILLYTDSPDVPVAS